MSATLGNLGEEAALRLYLGRGYSLVARNWRCSIGEIDLILTKGKLLVFCEVKSRRGAPYGGGYEAVTARKRAKLRALAEAFIGSPVCHRFAADVSFRFDVASVQAPSDGSAPVASDVHLFEDAF